VRFTSVSDSPSDASDGYTRSAQNLNRARCDFCFGCECIVRNPTKQTMQAAPLRARAVKSQNRSSMSHGGPCNSRLRKEAEGPRHWRPGQRIEQDELGREILAVRNMRKIQWSCQR